MKKLSILPIALALLGCGIPKPTPFYTHAATLPPALQPGDVESAEPYTPAIPQAAAYRIIYSSRDEAGHPVNVSGVVYIPLAPPPSGGRNLVAWAHPTTGIVNGCAPSLYSGAYGTITLAQSIPGLQQFIAAGDVVAATDYQGLGTPGPHPYLIGKAEGQDILDSVRAASHLPGADLSGNFVVFGHSQGAQAALFAGQLAASYTPSLHLMGVVAAAPPTDLNGELTEPFRDTAGRLLASYIYTTWSQIYGVPVTSIVDPRAVPDMERVAAKCIATPQEGLAALHAAGPLKQLFRSHNPRDVPPWPTLFTANSPGNAPPGAPVLILQGLADTTVEPHWTISYVRKICALHENVDFHTYPGVAHGLLAYKSLDDSLPWIAARFAGAPAKPNCAT